MTTFCSCSVNVRVWIWPMKSLISCHRGVKESKNEYRYLSILKSSSSHNDNWSFLYPEIKRLQNNSSGGLFLLIYGAAVQNKHSGVDKHSGVGIVQQWRTYHAAVKCSHTLAPVLTLLHLCSHTLAPGLKKVKEYGNILSVGMRHLSQRIQSWLIGWITPPSGRVVALK